jgi:DtxR family Mn-dependent transcriptional regulator
MKSYREENYLKAIYQLQSDQKNALVSITDIANWLELKSPTVLEKLNTLVKKGLISYNKKDGAKLTKQGKEIALNIVRRHRIWETYLQKELNFNWAEVHEIAEQLEHVDSDKLLDKIYEILGKPNFDPHGDPIPNKQGVIPNSDRRPLSKSIKGCKCLVLGVSEHSENFLNYLTELDIKINDKLTVQNVIDYDGTLYIENKEKKIITLSSQSGSQILVSCTKINCDCKKK